MIATECTLRGIRLAEPGTPLDPTFTSYAALIAADYTCTEDLVGADVEELQLHGLSYRDATAVIAAL